MLNGWHVRWVCWPCKNWDVFSFQELCTDPCNMGPCIIMLQHEVMIVDEWHNNGPQDLVTVFLCIQNAINKMHLCLLSITYACPYHNPTATMGHSIHNVDIIKPLTHMMPYTLSAICPVQWKPGFIREENTSPKCQMPSNVSICPLKSVTMTNCSQVETLMRTTSMQMSFPETVSDSLCRNSLVMQTDCCSSCPGGWSQTILEVRMLVKDFTPFTLFNLALWFKLYFSFRESYDLILIWSIDSNQNVQLPSQQTNLAQIWHASGTAGIHPALAYSIWAKHGPGLAEVVPGLRRHSRHGPDVKCSIWPRCQK